MDAIAPLLPFLFLIFFAVIAVVIIVCSQIAEKQRRETWQQAAEGLGFEYTERDDSLREKFPFKIFNQGHSRKTCNVLSGTAQGTSVSIADYRYTTGSGKHSHTYRQTVCILQSDSLKVAHIFVRAQGFFDFFGKLFGGQDINFDDDAEFSSSYVLQGEDEAAVRRLFTPEVRAFFRAADKRQINFEAARNAMLIHYGRELKPDDVQGLLRDAFQLLSLLNAGDRGEKGTATA